MPVSFERTDGQADWHVGNHVALQIEANAQVLGQAIRAVERSDGIAAGHQEHGSAAGCSNVRRMYCSAASDSTAVRSAAFGQHGLHGGRVLAADDNHRVLRVAAA